jgi:hypothetical protein
VGGENQVGRLFEDRDDLLPALLVEMKRHPAEDRVLAAVQGPGLQRADRLVEEGPQGRDGYAAANRQRHPPPAQVADERAGGGGVEVLGRAAPLGGLDQFHAAAAIERAGVVGDLAEAGPELFRKVDRAGHPLAQGFQDLHPQGVGDGADEAGVDGGGSGRGHGGLLGMAILLRSLRLFNTYKPFPGDSTRP